MKENYFFYEALKVVVDFGHATESLLQRRLKINYSLAEEIIMKMEINGFIDKKEGTRPRKIIICKEELNNILGRNLWPKNLPFYKIRYYQDN